MLLDDTAIKIGPTLRNRTELLRSSGARIDHNCLSGDENEGALCLKQGYNGWTHVFLAPQIGGDKGNQTLPS